MGGDVKDTIDCSDSGTTFEINENDLNTREITVTATVVPQRDASAGTGESRFVPQYKVQPPADVYTTGSGSTCTVHWTKQGHAQSYSVTADGIDSGTATNRNSLDFRMGPWAKCNTASVQQVFNGATSDAATGGPHNGAPYTYEKKAVINKPQELRWSDNAHVINVTGGSVDVYGKSATVQIIINGQPFTWNPASHWMSPTWPWPPMATTRGASKSPAGRDTPVSTTLRTEAASRAHVPLTRRGPSRSNPVPMSPLWPRTPGFLVSAIPQYRQPPFTSSRRTSMSENIDDATQLSDTTRLSDSTQLSDSTHLSDATHLASAPHTGTTPSTESAPQSVALPNLPQRPSQAPSEKPSPTTDAASIPAGDDSTVLKPRKGSTPAIPQQATAQSQPQSQPQRQSSKAAQAAASALPASINSGLLPQPTAQVRDFQQSFNALVENVSKVVIGKTIPIKQCVTALMVGGHILLEDNPGTGKTQLARGLANSISTGFKRVQFTPDLLPSDVVGVTFYDQKRGEFEFREGPIFASIVLADEINRASPKTQSALLEVMEEQKVTVDGVIT